MIKERYLARTVIDSDGRRCPLAVLTLPGDGSHSIEPFVEETAATVYINGTLVVGAALPAGYRRLRRYCTAPEVWECENVNAEKS